MPYETHRVSSSRLLIARVLSCVLLGAHNSEDAQKAADERGFVYHRYSGKYCLRRGRSSTCVQEATSGSALLLRRPSISSACLRHDGRGQRARYVECNEADEGQAWVYHTRTSTFRPATDAALCLDLFSPDEADYRDALATRSGGGGGGGGGGGSDDDDDDDDDEQLRLLATLDGGGALGSWPCRARAPNERFVFDRYMARYCVSSRPNVCVVEAILGAPLRLKRPGGVHCFQFDGALHSLHESPCNASDPRQMWHYDQATLVFRHTSDSSRCVDFFVAHGTFGAWSCRDDLEVNPQQQFRYDEERDAFCLMSDRGHCLQEATSALLY